MFGVVQKLMNVNVKKKQKTPEYKVLHQGNYIFTIYFKKEKKRFWDLVGVSAQNKTCHGWISESNAGLNIYKITISSFIKWHLSSPYTYSDGFQTIMISAINTEVGSRAP